MECSRSVGLRSIHINFTFQQRLDVRCLTALHRIGERRWLWFCGHDIGRAQSGHCHGHGGNA
jgi:hypothetical protein